MPLRTRRALEYFCEKCGYITSVKPFVDDYCPACNDGKPRWAKEHLVYPDPLDEDRATSMDGGD